jgi:hypothetical protein
MIAPPQSQKHFGSAQKRFLQSSIETFLDREFPRTFGPVIRQKLVACPGSTVLNFGN